MTETDRFHYPDRCAQCPVIFAQLASHALRVYKNAQKTRELIEEQRELEGIADDPTKSLSEDATRIIERRQFHEATANAAGRLRTQTEFEIADIYCKGTAKDCGRIVCQRIASKLELEALPQDS